MWPFLVNTNNYELPLSGNVTQDISPHFFAAMKGTPEVEKAVVTKIASYGDQLATLTDAVLALAGEAHKEDPAVKKLQDLADEVKTTKTEVKAALRARAEDAMRRLREADEDAYNDMMKTVPQPPAD